MKRKKKFIDHNWVNLVKFLDIDEDNIDSTLLRIKTIYFSI